MADSKSLEELTFNEERIVNSSGSGVTATPIRAPVILCVNERDDPGRDEGSSDEDEVRIITKSAPEDANAYMKGP